MNSIFCSICSKKTSYTIRSFLSSFFAVSWSNKISPFFNCIIAHKLHSNCQITCYKINKSFKKWLPLMFSIKLTSCLLCKFRHFHPVYFKPIILNCIYNLSNIWVSIWLNHSKCPLSINFKLPSCSYIAIIHDFEDS